MNLWHVFLFQPLVNLLVVFYLLFFKNMGLAIIGLTLVIRLALMPITTKQLKTAQQMKKLAPELEKLKKQYANDKQQFAQEQLKLYKKHGANPASGCLPTIIQFVILIALFQAFNQVLQADGSIIEKLNEVLYSFLKLSPDTIVNTRFLYLDITKPDVFMLSQPVNLAVFKLDRLPGLFLLAAAAVQYFSSKMMIPKKDPVQVAKEKAQAKSGNEDMASMMQQQMVFLAPVMTLVIGFRFASGLVLYWLSFSLFMLVQQLIIKSKQKQA